MVALVENSKIGGMTDQRPRLYNGAPFNRLLRHAGDTEDVFSA